ncbi:MAG: Lipin-3, partial [Paramarteilia canceri]
KSLNLKEGANKFLFKLLTAFQGKKEIECTIYLWSHKTKIIISDIDGTITKSDLLGHVFPLIGKHWYHTGISKLYNKIIDQGYKIVYVTMRPIGYSRLTRNQLNSMVVDNFKMPSGPLMVCPLGLISSSMV